jgi:hypothetical protein
MIIDAVGTSSGARSCSSDLYLPNDRIDTGALLAVSRHTAGYTW